jgi:hypothetical protein
MQLFKFHWSECWYGATGANNSNFMGLQAGKRATNAYLSNFFGQVLVI